MSHADEIKIAYQWYRLLEWKRRKELNTKYGCSDDNITNDVVLEIYNAEHSKAHKPTEDKELFTTGEWKAILDPELPEQILSNNCKLIAHCRWEDGSPFGKMTTKEAEANALLIAASKDLYYALKQLKIVAAETTSNLIAWDGAEPLDAAIDKAEKALNKAIGK